MRLFHWTTASALLFVAFLAQPASAAVTVPAAPFATVAVPDEVLAGQRAGYAVSPRLPGRSVQTVIDDQARSTERLSAGIARVSMDVWWGSIGSEMIATNVRAAGVR